MDKILEVKNLNISFRTQGGKVQAVRDISFDLYRGETLALVGESGSGKSVTNRAIMGILAGNAIINGGEIIYDGQDLLKVREEDFHKLRGDKIAMIFQDPMSSLNPIMRVGKQLTEAMILKGRSSQKNARNSFNTRLALIKKYMDEASPELKVQNASLCKTFDSFCVSAVKMESEYNAAHERAVEIVTDIDDILLLGEKNRLSDGKRRINKLLYDIRGVYSIYFIRNDSPISALAEKLKSKAVGLTAKNASVDADIKKLLCDIKDILASACEAEAPNFFCLGYYMMRNPSFDVSSVDVSKLNSMTRKYIDEEFMNEFISREIDALKISFERSLEGKKSAVSQLEEAIVYFRGQSVSKQQTEKMKKSLSDAVKSGIDELAIRKDGIAYTFDTSFAYALDHYFSGVDNNPKELARFEKQSKKLDSLIKRGKNPDWKVVPAAVVDLEDAKDDICRVLEYVRDSYKAVIESASTYDFAAVANAQVDYLKDCVSAFVFKMTRRLAKTRALKLLEEVGIPEPSVRYRQYPFEFSGGMRQRIVIAIALAANPDILICDEPTTALDVTIQSQILELINRIKAERNLSVIFITHDLGVVANMADRIAVMYAGKIVEYGTADDIFYNPRHPYTWALLSSMPDLDTKEKLEAIPGTPPNMIYPPVGDAFAARNKYALEIDFEEQPPMFKVSDTHYAATWLLHPKAPKVDPPKIVTDRIARMEKREADHNG